MTAFSSLDAHYLLDVGFDIGATSGTLAFHEGFSDVMAHLIHDTEVWGQDFFGCGLPAREALVSNRLYPDCDTDSHARGEVLSAVWLNILSELRVVHGQTIGLQETQDLHRAWMPIAQAPGPHPIQCTTRDQSASPATLIEVLVADSPDDDPANAPHLTQICDAFGDQWIFFPALCGGDSSVLACYADCDASGTLDIFDFLCFQDAFVAASLSSDCDGDGQLDIFDFVCFQSAFAAGCP